MTKTFTFTIPSVQQPVVLTGEGLSIQRDEPQYIIWRETGGNAESNPPVCVGTLTMPDGTKVSEQQGGV